MKIITGNPINIPSYPLEFEQIITAKNHNFVGREFVFAAINNFLNQYDRGYFTIIGDPGIGKSAILAHYVSQNPGVVYYNVEITGKNRVEEFLTTICTQLIEIAQNQDSKTCVERSRNNLTTNFPDFTTEGSGFLSLLLQKISDKLYPEQRLIITIDGCDRIDINNQPRGSNIFYLPRYLPEKVYFILTRRPFLTDKSDLLVENPAQSFDLSAYSEQNRADIQEYIKSYLNESSHSVDASAASRKVRSISEESNPGDVSLNMIQGFDDETNFMYVKEILTAINEDIYPQNLQLYYQNHLEKMNLATSKQQPMALQVLNILVQEQPISIEAIAERLDADEYEIKVILDKWREFLHLESIAVEIHYSIYHASFRDWLRQQIESNF
ncbi:ATP-binding protein [Nostoc sp.]|uniref:ATP-binding protein n=1 Tax=Nostoc sp. TaxID=1180 RepID=UPI002FF825FF